MTFFGGPRSQLDSTGQKKQVSIAWSECMNMTKIGLIANKVINVVVWIVKCLPCLRSTSSPCTTWGPGMMIRRETRESETGIERLKALVQTFVNLVKLN